MPWRQRCGGVHPVTVRARLALVIVAALLGATGCGAQADQAQAQAQATASALARARQNALDNEVSDLEEARQTLQQRVEQLSSATAAQGSGAAAAPAGSGASAGGANSVGTSSQAGASDSSGADSDFAALTQGLSGSSGIAYLPVGSTGTPTTLGGWSSGVAWSTMKVPVAIAAVRADGARPSSATTALLRRAITASDNAAAEGLWSRLGSGAKAAAATTAVLRDGADRATVVPATRTRPGFTAFGQSVWSLSQQTRFAAALPCVKGAAPVLSLMGQVTSSQRWGLGTLGASARFKGGWGPGTSGGYLVRQFGVITLPRGGQLAVALASEPADGSFATGTANLTVMARWLQARLGSLRGGSCSG